MFYITMYYSLRKVEKCDSKKYVWKLEDELTTFIISSCSSFFFNIIITCVIVLITPLTLNIVDCKAILNQPLILKRCLFSHFNKSNSRSYQDYLKNIFSSNSSNPHILWRYLINDHRLSFTLSSLFTIIIYNHCCMNYKGSICSFNSWNIEVRYI